MEHPHNIFTYFESAVERHAARPAIESPGRFRRLRWRYRELGRHTRALIAALAGAGVAPGDRVLLYAGTSPWWVAAYFAVLGRGAVVVPLNPQSPAVQLDRIAASAEPKLALVSVRLPWPAADLPVLSIEHGAAVPAEATDCPGRDADPGGLCEIVYTSGTTGDPKGVMLTHANLLANIRMIGDAVPVAPGDHLLSILPLFHMYAQMTTMLYPLGRGCAVTCLPAPSSRLILEALARDPVTHLATVPEFLKTVMDRIDERRARVPRILQPLLRPRIRRRISRTLHTIVSGGAPLDAEVERKWRELGFEVLQGYGLTETSPVLATNTPAAHRAASVGRPCTGVEVRIAADGEIQVRGPNVMQGYFRNERKTQESFTDGWLRTGDSGHFDADGFLYVHGRQRYMILGPAGENVFPEDIENELNGIAGVRDSAVFGMEKGGRVVVHAVILCDGCDGDAIVARANARLAPHQRIMSWSLWPEADFPRSATRKPKKEDIIARTSAGGGSAPAADAAATPLIVLLARVTRHDPAAIHAGTRIAGDLALDSLLRIELLGAIEEQFNAVLDESAISAQTTVADLEREIEQRGGRAPIPIRYPRWPQSPWAGALRPLVRGALLDWWLRFICRVEVSGLAHLEGIDGPVIFMANHRSFLDTPALLAALPPGLRRRLGIAAGTAVLYRRFGWIAPLVDLAFNSYPLPTEAGENVKAGLEYTGRLLDDGWNVLIYPEGQMNTGSAPLLPLKAGTGLLAVEMQVPVIPVAITGSDRILPPQRLLPRGRGTVAVRFGEALQAEVTATYPEALQRIESALQEMVSAPTAHE
jgi:long-chain acyl-CoA synthetase